MINDYHHDVTEFNICSLNVQGLNKFNNDQTFLQFCKKYDIIGLYETWQRKKLDFDSFLEGYVNFDCMRQPKGSAPRGSGGVTVFVKDYLVDGNIIRRVFDNLTECVVLFLNSEFYESVNDILLIFTYIAPERSPIYTPENDDGIVLLNEKLLEIRSVYPNADMIVAGDLNARTKDFLDFIPNDDLDFVFGETDYPSDIFNLNRNTKDLQAYNKFGLSLVDLCCEHDIHMLNGRLFDDTEGNITCIANEGRSLVDYIIASSNFFDKFSYFGVDNHDFSDHFPLTCSLQLNNISHETDTYDDTDTASKWDKYKWKESLKQEFLD